MEINFHLNNKKLVTVTAVVPPGRFGSLDVQDNNLVKKFIEKPNTEFGFINGGFFVVNKKAIQYIDGDDTPWEKAPLEKISAKKQLVAFKHEGFWQPMDTLREKNMLESLWASGMAPWKIWND